VDEQYISGLAYISLGDTESYSKLFFVAWHAHKDGNALLVDDDLEWFFEDHPVVDKLLPLSENAADRPLLAGDHRVSLWFACIFAGICNL
jgi:hypothetical protein